ncbi:unnamed protein product [Gongylonema pulchrum]|uniref:PRKCSH_1 domain-containing protein n=1 Tax=Gongylonema pulchrum TaxID=637853 RepID=A0A183CWV4_9BILA|nr:unnamed protein product [Gongylonema pulchrum]
MDSYLKDLFTEEAVRVKSPQIPNVDKDKPAFNEETKAIIKAFNICEYIAEAEEAKSKYEEIDKRHREIEDLIKDVDWYASTDVGDDAAWASLKGKCIEMNENEYTYKLCLFDRATQKSRSNDFEIEIGKWGSWIGEPDKFTVQKYENGAACWNGPERSTKVYIECGEETELVEVSEPNKCEYLFTVRSPVACPDPALLTDQHEEL